MLEPLPTGAWAFLAVTTAVATNTLSFGQAFSAFTNDVIWLIVVSFFFAAVRIPLAAPVCHLPPARPRTCLAKVCVSCVLRLHSLFCTPCDLHLRKEHDTTARGSYTGLYTPVPALMRHFTICQLARATAAQGFQKTGLGERVANMFVAACGKSTLGLAYGLAVAEALLAPAMPSTTARAGGIFMPIINSLSLASDSKPGALLRCGWSRELLPTSACWAAILCTISTSACWSLALSAGFENVRWSVTIRGYYRIIRTLLKRDTS